MINEDKQGLEDVLRHNNAMRRTQEKEEDLQCQEESWREDHRIRKSKEEAEERQKQSEMDACMNKNKQVPEYQEAANPQCNTEKEQERVHTAHKYIKISSDSSPSLSSDDLLETSSYDSSDSGTR